MRAEQPPHVCLSRVDSDGILDDAVEDGLGCGVAAEAGVPLARRVLRAEERGVEAVAAFDQLEHEMRLRRRERERGPLVDDEQVILAQAVQ